MEEELTTNGELPQEKPEMIELSIQMNDDMNYNICIPKVITPQTFPEIIKRLKSVRAIIPEKDITPHRKGDTNPVLSLGIEQSRDVFEKYKTLGKTEFEEFLLETYRLEYDNWTSIVGLMGKVKQRIKKMENEE